MTHYDEEIRVAGLHSGCGRCVLVPHKVLRVDDGDYRVQLEISISLAFQFPQLECECRWERRAGAFDDNSIRPEVICDKAGK